jgi:hypothetical protein
MWVLGNPRLIAAFPMTSMQPGASGKAADSNCCPQSAARFGSHISRSSPTHTARSRAWTDQNKARGTLQIRSLRTGLESRLNYSHSIVNRGAEPLWGGVPPDRFAPIPSIIPKNTTGTYRLYADLNGEPVLTLLKQSRRWSISRRMVVTIPSLIPSGIFQRGPTKASRCRPVITIEFAR